MTFFTTTLQHMGFAHATVHTAPKILTFLISGKTDLYMFVMLFKNVEISEPEFNFKEIGKILTNNIGLKLT